MNDDLRQNIAR